MQIFCGVTHMRRIHMWDAKAFVWYMNEALNEIMMLNDENDTWMNRRRRSAQERGVKAGPSRLVLRGLRLQPAVHHRRDVLLRQRHLHRVPARRPRGQRDVDARAGAGGDGRSPRGTSRQGGARRKDSCHWCKARGGEIFLIESPTNLFGTNTKKNAIGKLGTCGNGHGGL